MPTPVAPPGGRAQPQDLHPALWRAHQLGHARAPTVATGYAALDAELPGGGWSCQALTELLLPHTGVGEWRLLAPALAGLGRAPVVGSGAGRILLFAPPATLFAWALAPLGIDPQRLVVVHGRQGGAAQNDVLWALEQALKSGHAAAVLAWLPTRVRAENLRRLQWAAQAHDGPAFLLRPADASSQPSPAPLRLSLVGGAVDELCVQVLKRRGPAQATPLRLALPAVLPCGMREDVYPAPVPAMATL